MARKLSIILCFLLFSCNGDVSQKRVIDVSILSIALGVELRYFDSSVRPQDDFYQYINGRWLDLMTLPEDRSSFGSFSEVSDTVNYEILKNIKSIMVTPDEALNLNQQKIKNLTTSFNNLAQIEAIGLSPLAEDLERVASLKTNDDILFMIGYLARLGVDGPIEVRMDPDLSNPGFYLTQMSQEGLTLPDRTYYDWTGDKGQALKATFESFVQTMLGDDVSRNRVQSVVGFETRLSSIMVSRQDQRDLVKSYNKNSISDLKLAYPNLKWDEYFRGVGINPKAVNVRETLYLKNLSQLVRTVPLQTWKDYFRVRLLGKMANYLPRKYDLARFNLHDKAIRGLAVERKRNLRGFAVSNLVFADYLSEEYIKDNVDPSLRGRVQNMVENIKRAFKIKLANNPWMDEVTKAEAFKKIDALRVRIGWPNVWKSMDDLDMGPNNLAGNMFGYYKFSAQKMLAKADKPVNIDDWPVTPRTVNALYSSTLNTMTLPIGIFNTPFFDVSANEAVNYGGIGAIIGHEIIHGFDDQGRKFDASGKLHDWWSDASEAEFTRRSNALVRLYDGVEVLEGAKVNGRQTLGENIADFGGVALAYEAYKQSLGGRKSETIVGFTGEQRFFMGWAQVWRRIYRDQELRRRIAVDNHSPTKLRVNLVLSMFPGFTEAFKLKPKDRLYKKPEDQIVIY